MGYPNKIDNDKLRQFIAEGKFSDEIAKEFGVVVGAVNTRIKRLGLTPNYRRQPHVRQNIPDFTYSRQMDASLPDELPVNKLVEGQIIPVTLRLVVDVHVRISASELVA